MIRKKETGRLFAKDITGDLVKDRQEVTINWRAGQLVLDEPSFNGGKDIGPGSVYSCTVRIGRVYFDHVTYVYPEKGMGYNRHTLFGKHVTRDGTFKGRDLQNTLVWPASDGWAKGKVALVAKNCPVAKLLQGEIVIDTQLSDDAAVITAGLQ